MVEPTRSLAQLTRGIFLPFAFCYVLSFLFRASPAVLNEEISEEMLISGSELGAYASVFFLCMALCQIPVGILLDLVGPRKMASIGVILAGGGALLSWAGSEYITLVFARAVMGVGMAGAMMCTLKAVKEWFPPDRVFMFSGFTGAAGSIGGLLATAPLEMINNLMGWRFVFLLMSLASLAAGIIVYTVVPVRPASMRTTMKVLPLIKTQIREFRFVLGLHVLHLLAPPTALLVGTTMSFQTLWAGPWMHRVEMRSEEQTAMMLGFFVLMQLLTQILLGRIKRLIGFWGWSVLDFLSIFIVLQILSYTLVLLLSSVWSTPFWMVLGITMAIGITSFAIVGEAVPAHYVGRALTVLNTFVFLAVFVIQWLMGLMIDLFPRDALGLYPVSAYQWAMILGLGCLLLGSGWYYAYLGWFGRLGLKRFVYHQLDS